MPDNEITPLPLGALMDATGLTYYELFALPRIRKGNGPAVVDPKALGQVLLAGPKRFPKCGECGQMFVRRNPAQERCRQCGGGGAGS